MILRFRCRDFIFHIVFRDLMPFQPLMLGEQKDSKMILVLVLWETIPDGPCSLAWQLVPWPPCCIWNSIELKCKECICLCFGNCSLNMGMYILCRKIGALASP